MNESVRTYVSGRFTVKLSSLRPLTLSNEDEEDDTCGDVGDVAGDVEGEIAVLILVVRARRRGIFVRQFAGGVDVTV